MAKPAEDPAPEAATLPSGRVARTARIGGLAASQGARWAGMRAANRVRTPQRAAAAEQARTAALISELVDRLSQMRGAAMKVGQMLSLADLDGLPEDQRDELQRKLASLRDDVPPVSFASIERLLRQELGGPLERFFSDFDERAFAAASIGQVHRATTVSGAEVVVKVQYPGVAEAVETDLRNAMLLVPLIRRLAPGLDAKALGAELRERIGEELDYELEAQNQRRVVRLLRGHPFMRVPRVHSDLSSRRVLVSDYVAGERFEAVRAASEVQRDRYAEVVFRFFFGLLYRDQVALGDPHPGNYLSCADGSVCFLDFGLLRQVSRERVSGEAAVARAVRADDERALKEALVVAGYLPAQRADAVDASFLLELMRSATGWYALPGERRFAAADQRDTGQQARAAHGQKRGEPERRAAARDQVNQLTLPPEAILIRRMHGVLAAVLEALRAGADWGAIAAEYLHGEPPATELGRLEAAFYAGRTGAQDLGRAG
jgi:predicted unusual protein kinase regulating ubiquinone biosynthesis (AarF/ABC1/UbiB family)